MFHIFITLLKIAHCEEHEFIIKKAQRGRPKKDTTADDTASESSEIITTEKKR